MEPSWSRDASREQWAGAAEGWAKAAKESETGASGATARWMLQAAQLRPGEQVLELACGAGRVGLQAAEAVGPTGHVVCSDFAEPMVESVRQRVAELHLDNLETRVLDAEDLALPEGEAFDAVLCRFGYMLMSDPLKALEESRQALKPDGRLILAVWGRSEDNPWLMHILKAVMDELGAAPPEPGTPGPFALGDVAKMDELLAAAGFSDAEVVELEASQDYDSLEQWWQSTIDLGGPLAALLEALPDARVATIREQAFAAAQPSGGAGGAVVLAARVVAAQACRG